MATWRVTHEDGRTTDVIATDERTIKKQANHQEITRKVIAERIGKPERDDPSLAVSYEKIKD